MDVGFIGLGNMGFGIARSLLRAGHTVTVWNRTAAKAEPLGADGATIASTPGEAAKAGIVMSMLADDHAVAEVVFGEGGILAGAPEALHVSMSTISVALAKRMADAHAEAGSALVSAPVFGRPAAAESAKLFVVAAGEGSHLDRAAPLFDAVGQKSFIVGDAPYEANLVKLAGNFMIAGTTEMLAEAMALGEKGGVARAKLLEVLAGTLFGSPIVQNYGGYIRDEAYLPAGFAAPLGLKDLRLVGEAAEELRVPLPLLGIARDHLLETIAIDGEEIDWSALAKSVFRGAGLK
ncbi:MAG: NAD(P)-dependent oxidoreductase [Sphingomonadaceae bacterium]|nr:NAD(P)-dependent oxidoreductase [Sphingomonadaceae bacterium]